MEAAIGVVSLILRLVKFLGLNDAERHAERFGERAGLLHVAPGKARRVRQHSQHAIAKHAMRSGGKKCRIDSAGVGDHDTAELAQTVFKRAQLGLSKIVLRNSGMRSGCHGCDYTCSIMRSFAWTRTAYVRNAADIVPKPFNLRTITLAATMRYTPDDSNFMEVPPCVFRQY